MAAIISKLSQRDRVKQEQAAPRRLGPGIAGIIAGLARSENSSGGGPLSGATPAQRRIATARRRAGGGIAGTLAAMKTTLGG